MQVQACAQSDRQIAVPSSPDRAGQTTTLHAAVIAPCYKGPISCTVTCMHNAQLSVQVCELSGFQVAVPSWADRAGREDSCHVY